MTIASRRLRLCGALLASILFSSLVAAQSTTPPTALDRQLARVDLGVLGVGEYTKDTSGATILNQPLSLKPSTTLGALVTIRYIKSPLIGLEFNYGYARYTDNFTPTAVTPTATTQYALGLQTNVSEYTFGYLAHTPHYFGVQPFLGAGAGTLAFRPTNGGGEGYKPQARAAYYYTVGAEAPIYGEHFGLRAQFRQVFFLAPDYETNYLTNKQRSTATEPAVGFFLRF